jgi:hypothetical protein
LVGTKKKNKKPNHLSLLWYCATDFSFHKFFWIPAAILPFFSNIIIISREYRELKCIYVVDSSYIVLSSIVVIVES